MVNKEHPVAKYLRLAVQAASLSYKVTWKPTHGFDSVVEVHDTSDQLVVDVKVHDRFLTVREYRYRNDRLLGTQDEQFSWAEERAVINKVVGLLPPQ